MVHFVYIQFILYLISCRQDCILLQIGLPFSSNFNVISTCRSRKQLFLLLPQISLPNSYMHFLFWILIWLLIKACLAYNSLQYIFHLCSNIIHEKLWVYTHDLCYNLYLLIMNCIIEHMWLSWNNLGIQGNFVEVSIILQIILLS